jgi:hypothetical protein
MFKHYPPPGGLKRGKRILFVQWERYSKKIPPVFTSAVRWGKKNPHSFIFGLSRWHMGPVGCGVGQQRQPHALIRVAFLHLSFRRVKTLGSSRPQSWPALFLHQSAASLLLTCSHPSSFPVLARDATPWPWWRWRRLPSGRLGAGAEGSPGNGAAATPRSRIGAGGAGSRVGSGEGPAKSWQAPGFERRRRRPWVWVPVFFPGHWRAPREQSIIS